MNILFDLGHPAHVHLFRNSARTLMEKGNTVIFSIRDREDIKDLLQLYGFPWLPASIPRTSLPGLCWELLEHDWEVLKIALKYKIKIIAGTSVAAAHVSRLLPGVVSAVFGEDDACAVPLYAKLTYPFAHKVVVPCCISDKIRSNYVLHDSYHELAYLHPNHFSPDPSALKELRVNPSEPYFIVRLVALKAHHDIGERGISRELQERLIRLLSGYGKVFVTTEGALPEEFEQYQLNIPPHMMHHAMAFARLMVTDSQTMAAESAVLGVPVFRCNTFVGRLAYLTELEEKYKLAFGYLPEQAEMMMSHLEQHLQLPDIQDAWQTKRNVMLAEKGDMHLWMTDFLLQLGESR